MTTLGLFIQNDIYPSPKTDPEKVVNDIIGSKLTTPILGLCHVNCSTATCPSSEPPGESEDGDITFNDTLIVRGGDYVGDQSWPSRIQNSLRAGQVTKVFASFGGYGVPDYERIGRIIAKYGTGKDSPLYKNFSTLKDKLGLDGIDFDNEDVPDQDTTVQFAQMLLGLGYEVTFCPFGEKKFWSDCIKALGADKISWLNLQCYAGGKSNNPADWADMGVPVVAGVCANCCCPNTTCTSEQVEDLYTLWTTGKGSVSSDCWEGKVTNPINVAGGFIWTYADIANNFTAYVDGMYAGLTAAR